MGVLSTARNPAGLAVAFALALPGCDELPPVRYETQHLRIGARDSLCAGTRADLDDHVGLVELLTRRTAERIDLYWVDDAEPWCDAGRTGCFFPGTRIIVATPDAARHEIVHAVLQTDRANLFLEEGLAEYLSGSAPARASDVRRDWPSRMLTSDGGAIDYAAAAHFVRWLVDRGGPESLPQLAEILDEGGDVDRARASLADLFGTEFAVLEAEYLADDGALSLGPRAARVESESWDGGEWRIELDCEAEDTRGPIDDAAMVRVIDVVLHRQVDVIARLDGDPDARLTIGRHGGGEGGPIDPMLPRPGARALVVPGGVDTRVQLPPGTHRFVFAAATAERASLVLRPVGGAKTP